MTVCLQQQPSESPLINTINTDFLYNEFNDYTSGGQLTTTGSTGTTAQDSTTSVMSASNVLLTTGGSTNNTQGVATTNAVYLIQANQNMHFATRIYYQNQATGNANILFAVSSSTSLQPNGGGDLTASYSGFALYKINSSTDTAWHFQVSNATTKSTYTSTTNAGDGTYLLEVDVINNDNLGAVCIPKVNGVQLRDANNIPIRGVVLFSGLSAGKMYVSAQAGSGNAQTCYVDFVNSEKFRL